MKETLRPSKKDIEMILKQYLKAHLLFILTQPPLFYVNAISMSIFQQSPSESNWANAPFAMNTKIELLL